ncbi:hypothetical protein XELAEV_18038060mg [Xenopus laevis]|uniref:Uncharacterized protein n=1 Tax=Xenopus laevis TaxID=8355 RepID=A0A974CDB8_XENLA|nr:hypothetical protein XELAEV_18038060mg [Xenopus laevis]
MTVRCGDRAGTTFTGLGHKGHIIMISFCLSYNIIYITSLYCFTGAYGSFNGQVDSFEIWKVVTDIGPVRGAFLLLKAGRS